MNEQEEKIIGLLLNEMAFEGAIKHFHEQPPEISSELFSEIKEIGIPKKYDGQFENYIFETIEYDNGKTSFENCYRCLRIIRNNIIHANKAFRPDPPERLADLLAWSEKFITTVYEAGGDFVIRANEIKAALKIESF